jgi:hypothetical protein
VLAGRKWTARETFVADLQTGEGCALSLQGSAALAHIDLAKHKVWVCPMFEPFLAWLYEDGRWADGGGDLEDVPRYVELPGAESAMAGYRREGR